MKRSRLVAAPSSWLAGLLAAWFLASWSPPSRAADLPVVEIFGGAGTSSALALLRGELEVLGFVVKPRALSALAEAPELPWVYGRVVLAAGDRATAEVQVFPPRARARTVSRIDLGSIGGVGEGERNRVLTTLAVRVAELLRALDGQARPAGREGQAGPVVGAATESAPASALAAPRPQNIGSPSSSTQPAAVPPVAPPAIVTRATIAPVRAAPRGAVPRSDEADRDAGSARAAAEGVGVTARPFTPPGPLSAEAGIAAGSAITSGGVAVGPIVRIGWHLQTGLLVRATIATLAVADPLVAPDGRSSLVQTLALTAFGYRGSLWDGRLIPEVTVGLGVQHLLARGEAIAPKQGVVDQVVGFAAAAGLGLGFRASDTLVLGLNAELFRAFPTPSVFIGDAAVAEGRPAAGLASFTVRYLF